MSRMGSETYYSDSDGEGKVKEVTKGMAREGAREVAREVITLLDTGTGLTGSARRRKVEEKQSLVEALSMVNIFRKKLENELEEVETKVDEVDRLELKLKKLKLKCIGGRLAAEEAAEAAALVEVAAGVEAEASEMRRLERAFAGAAVRIQVEEADELLAKVGADTTDLRLRLTADPARDSEKVFLASLLLRRILAHSLAATKPAPAGAYTVPPPHSWFSNGHQEPLFHKGEFSHRTSSTKLFIGHPI